MVSCTARKGSEEKKGKKNRQLTLSARTASNAWIIRVECHHSGGLI